jgi:hypothetical protein
MTDTDSLSYFARRAAQERAAADQCGDPAARAVHLDLAGRYADLARTPPASLGSTPLASA